MLYVPGHHSFSSVLPNFSSFTASCRNLGSGINTGYQTMCIQEHTVPKSLSFKCNMNDVHKKEKLKEKNLSSIYNSINLQQFSRLAVSSEQDKKTCCSKETPKTERSNFHFQRAVLHTTSLSPLNEQHHNWQKSTFFTRLYKSEQQGHNISTICNFT